MTDKTSKAALSKVRESLDSRRPGEALAALRDIVESHRLWNYTSRIDTLVSGYKYMMEYMLNRGSDPGRKQFVANLLDDIRQLADTVERDIKAVDSPTLYFARVRTAAINPDNLAGLVTNYTLNAGVASARSENEQTLSQIFNYIWTTFPLQQGELALLTDTASDEATPSALRSQILSAMLLGGMEYYERGRIIALADIADHSSSLFIKARAVIALVLSLYSHPERALADAKLAERLQRWIKEEGNMRRLRTVITDIVKALNTERINKTLREEFLPAVNRLKPDIDRLFKQGGMTADGELNPEWEELMASSGLDKKLRHLSEMQEQGADLMMFAFSNLKNFGFFQELPNWFLPFETEHSSLEGIESSLSPVMMSLLETPGMMCDSDKYSFVLSLMRTPEEQRKLMFSQLQAQEESLQEAMAEAQLMTTDGDQIFQRESDRYLRDLNRFFKLFREHSQFRDVLHHPFSIADIAVLGEAALDDAEQLKVIGEFYLRNGFYRDALGMFRKLETFNGANPALIEKIGFCLQHLGDNQGALTEYRKAELFNPDSLWLIKHIAATARMTGDYVNAAEYYARVLEREPENTGALMNRGNALVEAGEIEEALRMYYKVNYLRPDHLNSLRAIAWVEFLNGNHAKSIDFHTRVLMSPDAAPSDYINAGHAYLTSGNLQDAVRAYLGGVRADKSVDNGLNTFRRIMASDRDTLTRNGVDPVETDLITDYVISSIREE